MAECVKSSLYIRIKNISFKFTNIDSFIVVRDREYIVSETYRYTYSSGKFPFHSGLQEYCQYERFNATCPEGKVLLLSEAKYGRMRLGKCLTTDVFIGCSSDVLSEFDALCSGRPRCEVLITNDALHSKTPCPKDMMTYLEAAYTCISGESHCLGCIRLASFTMAATSNAKTELCDATSGAIALTASSGFLVTAPIEHEHNSPASCYWRITVEKGQKILVDLLDFSLSNRYSSDENSNQGLQTEVQYCHVYAEIRETETTRHQTICAGSTRESRVYSSTTHSIEIFLNTVGTSSEQPKFMLKYTAVGCPDLPPPEGGRVIRDGERVTVRCNHTLQASHLICRGTKWVGQVQECDTNHASGRHKAKPGEFPTYGLLVAVIIGVIIGIVCGFSMLATVLWCKRRKSRRRPLNRHTEMELLPPSEDTNTAGRCKVQRLKGEYGLTHVWEVQGDDGSRHLHTHPISGTGSMSPDSAYLTYQGTSTGGASSIGTYPGPTGSSVSGSGSGRMGTLPSERGFHGGGRDHIYESPHTLPDGTRVHRSPLPCCRQFVEPPKGPVAVGTPMVPTTATCVTPPPILKTSNNLIEAMEASDENDDEQTAALTLTTKPKGYKLVPGSPEGPPAAPPRQRNENHYT
ncbi:hypothetical protein CAPTEDRAFT_222656 [Capitella teleta]|uniref:CUB domain-containing protein n=1 Tax=Capitella teleta TaxID=283909 RepID=R7U7X1_CAPTE|nr:hypothetical protein CAPTEDRAFT_222656 [Capitella teleta]|eukprot:ELT99771.1 hypothetical protein CAPTEDRAFT_222656 [Capitella teleta]